jgi:hypothetical protein
VGQLATEKICNVNEFVRGRSGVGWAQFLACSH